MLLKFISHNCLLWLCSPLWPVNSVTALPEKGLSSVCTWQQWLRKDERNIFACHPGLISITWMSGCVWIALTGSVKSKQEKQVCHLCYICIVVVASLERIYWKAELCVSTKEALDVHASMEPGVTCKNILVNGIRLRFQEPFPCLPVAYRTVLLLIPCTLQCVFLGAVLELWFSAIVGVAGWKALLGLFLRMSTLDVDNEMLNEPESIWRVVVIHALCRKITFWFLHDCR